MIIINSTVDDVLDVKTSLNTYGNITLQQLGAIKQSVDTHFDKLLIEASKGIEAPSYILTAEMLTGTQNCVDKMLAPFQQESPVKEENTIDN